MNGGRGGAWDCADDELHFRALNELYQASSDSLVERELYARGWQKDERVRESEHGKERRGGNGDWVGNGSSIKVKSGIWLEGAIDRQWSERRHGGHEGYKRSGGISGRMVWEGSGVVVE